MVLGKTLEVHGDGTQSRCFAYVGDAVRAVITLMETENAVGEIFNVGSTQEISIRDLAQKVIDMTDSESNIEYVPYENVYGDGFEDMKRRIPDISKIRNFIGWEPKVYLDELLQMIIDHEKHAIRSAHIKDTPNSFAYVSNT